MVSKELTALTALAGVVLAHSSPGLVTVLNTTDGASTIGQVASQAPGFLDAIFGKTNLILLTPNDTVIALWLNLTQGQAASAAGDDYYLYQPPPLLKVRGYNDVSD
ncbi:uncharacterized protein Z519_00430 [Cladophialophora bantiana CBS 173.52]|uniref:FAS1 domain-containing protein n=1 Tax=Cladophialophora bantiana (strain ATCC 10958 / CBS 173.52 / CDC B-1940 / NIH 8579) TaxID=1442370 RepID=A0A0D2GK37_CLAB1|nr:uncharacterized protein Z519_00430 [Cladophialophora bantiana CBS 173.52]KIW98767.1 hypothetical protein Z519_00430 [Cladophialophora bantiana CBS 173.52]